jgi:hypothetical protein
MVERPPGSGASQLEPLRLNETDDRNLRGSRLKIARVGSVAMTSGSKTEWIRRLAIGSIAGQLVWLVTVVLAGAVEPGYSAVRDAVSFLGARDAAHPWVFEVGVAIWGCSFIAAAIALLLDSPAAVRSLRRWLGPSLIAITGLAQILDGFPFPAQCRASIDPGCKALESAGKLGWQHYAHIWTYAFGAFFLLLSVFAMAWRFRGDARWGRGDLLATAAGLLGIAIFAVLFFTTSDEPGGHYGLVQRLALAAGGGWVLLLTAGLLVIHGPRGHLALGDRARPTG